MPLVLSLGGGEGRGKDGEKKKRKNCIHLASMFTSYPLLLLSPPASIFLHPHPSPSSCLSFADQSYSAPWLFHFFFRHCFFMPYSYHIKRCTFLQPPYVLSHLTSAHLPEHIFARHPLFVAREFFMFFLRDFQSCPGVCDNL